MVHLIRIVNDEDRRAVEWLITNVGETRVEAAAQRMGARRKSALCFGGVPSPWRVAASGAPIDAHHQALFRGR
ncbi:hypothetical protein [Paraburkholderia tropica]|uniref:hypothetical protein n=1 Tax=Paraburkholderia tropica TaxID=92647 RepID=UPI0026BA3917